MLDRTATITVAVRDKNNKMTKGGLSFYAAIFNSKADPSGLGDPTVMMPDYDTVLEHLSISE